MSCAAIACVWMVSIMVTGKADASSFWLLMVVAVLMEKCPTSVKVSV